MRGPKALTAFGPLLRRARAIQRAARWRCYLAVISTSRADRPRRPDGLAPGVLRSRWDGRGDHSARRPANL